MSITFTRLFDDRDSHGGWGKLRIDDAGPWEFMSSELMRQILHGSPWGTREGDTLTLWDDFGHYYIYLVGEYDYLRDGYDLMWSD